MPRKLRELEDGGIHHIYNRGNNRKRLFRDKRDFAVFGRMWLDARGRYGFSIYHYCWMSNHYHALVKVAQGKDLSRVMHKIQLGYARYFKRRYKTTGHVFQERYRSPRIAEESYYLQCGRYIERNPIAARMVKAAIDYEYSSAKYYGLGMTDELVTENIYYAALGKTSAERQNYYLKFLMIEDPYRAMVDEAFVKTKNQTRHF